ncbi:IS110 family transposase [Gilvimarinus sp. 2_MG-2023]|uniref:IS110 family transposase n=1 Tax=Gilvimarinus sp. 2_MG-2023 TaxID=3062666 RepID=UPI0026E3A87C|nr:IS110 family transposase [Gilvimarinus sp. 2_MG-2023]MDO6570065.1 IS110 family transposase [Gilvimarinus sp. 2_MG-2023]
MMNDVAVGIDVSKSKLDICIARDGKYKSKSLSNTKSGHKELTKWLEAQGVTSETPVALEATGPYSEAIAIHLSDNAWCVSVINPARISGFAKSELARNKTDKADAKLIARFALRADLEIWQPLTPAVRELRALVDRLQALSDMRQQELNRIEGLSETAQLTVKEMIMDHVQWLEKQIDSIKSDIDDHIDGNTELKQDAELIESIPGMGRRSTAQFLAYIGDVRRFKNAKALAAFIGVTPRQKQSGTSIKGRSSLSRTGHNAARKSLFMPGMVAKRFNPVIIAASARLEARGLTPKAIVGASMRRLVHMIYGVVKSGTHFNAKIPLSRLDFQEGI